jgi:NhaD family Na+/H+ antiporter
MYTLILITFILGYVLIAFEGFIKINKTAIALVAGVLCWAFYILNNYNKAGVNEQLYAHLGEISSLLFFLLSAMTIVEIMDAHHAFDIISSRIKTMNKRKLIWILGLVSFFLSAALDNLTTAIVMVSLLRKLIKDKETRIYFASLVIIAANAGGAWSPIGDVTTTMLWMGGQVTTFNIIRELFLPSLVCLIVPSIIFSFKMKGEVESPEPLMKKGQRRFPFDQKLILIVGIASLMFVPIFKAYTGLPPFMGILLGLGVVWVVTEFLHKYKDSEEAESLSVLRAIKQIDAPSILFFLGILLAVAALESTHQLVDLAGLMNAKIGRLDVIVLGIGLLSAIVDNVPLVAAAMGMYSLQSYPVDHFLWEFIAYCAGTGGSCLIIGSAAGVAAMGIEKIDFIWYLKKISWIALMGYLAGAAVYLLEQYL